MPYGVAQILNNLLAACQLKVCRAVSGKRITGIRKHCSIGFNRKVFGVVGDGRTGVRCQRTAKHTEDVCVRFVGAIRGADA